MKLSARCIMNFENLLVKNRSTSSICLILMLIRQEFTAGSMRVYSLSFLETLIGLRIECSTELNCQISKVNKTYPISTSGLQWRSTIGDGK